MWVCPVACFMLEARVNVEALDGAFTAIDCFVENCLINYDSGGVRFVAAGYSNVVSADVVVADEAFEYIETAGGVVGADVSRLKEVFNVIDPPREVDVEVDGRTLRLRADGVEYTTRLLGEDVVDGHEVPDGVTLPAEVALPGETVDRIVRLAEALSGSVTLHVDPSERRFRATAENGHESVTVDRGAEELLDIDPGTARSVFSVEHLARVTEVVRGDSTVRIRLGENCPAEVRVEFADGLGTATYYVAPKQSV